MTDLIPQTTRKLKCIFQKDATVHKHYSASVIFDSQGRVLLCKRSSYKKVAPNAWHLPGGTVELDESAVETVIRELKEELDLDAVTVLPTHVIINYTIDDVLYQAHIFLVVVSNEPTLMNSENSEFRFVPIDEISRYIEPHLVEDNVRAVKVAAAVLKTAPP